MFELYVPPFTANLKNVRVRSKDHRRFTMGDISRINNRVTNLERITSLSLLERDTQSNKVHAILNECSIWTVCSIFSGRELICGTYGG